jgi:transmembrane sensor
MDQKEKGGALNHGPAIDAARWFARLRSPECGATERHAFETWLAASDEHRSAYEKVARTASRVTDALKSDPRLRAMLDTELAKSSDRPLHKSTAPVARWRRLSIAAAWFAAIGMVAIGALPRVSAPPAAESLISYTNSEPRGKTVLLDDGSTLHLDTGSEVTVALSKAQRRLTLRQGRAYFEVAHDAQRPFTVDAAGTRTTALGTKFEVRLEPQGVTVTLAEGSVSVRPSDAKGRWKELLEPGQQLSIDAGATHNEKRQVDATRVTGWAEGRLYFDGVPLAQVLQDVNRYSSTKVVLGDERLAATPIGGNFAAGGDAGAFVQALSAILPLRSEPSGDREIVLFPRERATVAH